MDPLGLVDRIFPQTHLEKRWHETYDHALAANEISFQWLGTTGFMVRKGNFVVLIDPYLTRVGFPRLFLGPLVPDENMLREKIPRADYVFITDTHFDHCLDAPAIALRTGAKVVGSSTTAKILRLHNVPERQIIEVAGGETIQAGPFSVKVAKAQHGSIWIVKPFYGDVDASSGLPLNVWGYRNLENRCYHFSAGGFRFFATSGSDLDEQFLQGFQSDLVMANVTCLPAGAAERLLRITRPSVVFPTHYDDFFRPFADGVQPFPVADLKIFCRDVERLRPQAQLITLDFFQEYRRRL